MRRSLEGEQHLAAAIGPGGVADRFAVIRKRVGRFDRGGEGAVPHQAGELAVGTGDRFLRRAVQPAVHPVAVNTHPAEDEIDDRDAQWLSVAGAIADDGATGLQEGSELRNGFAGDRVEDQLEWRAAGRVGCPVGEIGALDQYDVGATSVGEPKLEN
jgi:hypothetical protein